jgi:hypothetical protein
MRLIVRSDEVGNARPRPVTPRQLESVASLIDEIVDYGAIVERLIMLIDQDPN